MVAWCFWRILDKGELQEASMDFLGKSTGNTQTMPFLGLVPHFFLFQWNWKHPQLGWHVLGTLELEWCLKNPKQCLGRPRKNYPRHYNYVHLYSLF
jgi:hypothetical protein